MIANRTATKMRSIIFLVCYQSNIFDRHNSCLTGLPGLPVPWIQIRDLRRVGFNVLLIVILFMRSESRQWPKKPPRLRSANFWIKAGSRFPSFKVRFAAVSTDHEMKSCALLIATRGAYHYLANLSGRIGTERHTYAVDNK